MDNLETVIAKAIEIEKQEDKELESLLKKAGFLFLPILLLSIKKTESSLDDVLQRDFEEVSILLETILLKYKKIPSKRKLEKLLSNREFMNSFEEEVSIHLKDSFLQIAAECSKKYNSIFVYDLMSDLAKKDLDKWLTELPKLMKLTTDDAVVKVLKETFENGKGVNWAVTRLSELQEFSRNRARTTAITEVLTMYSDATYQSFLQNESVIGMKWKHTPGIKEPRATHEALSGTIIPTDDFFVVNGEVARYPRDVQLSAKERISCHCRLEPVFYKDLKGGEKK